LALSVSCAAPAPPPPPPLLLQQVRLGKFLFHMMDERSVGK